MVLANCKARAVFVRHRAELAQDGAELALTTEETDAEFLQLAVGGNGGKLLPCFPFQAL